MSKRIVILGGDGMLGHQLLQHFNQRYEVWATLRNNYNTYQAYKIFNRENSLYEIDASNYDQLE